MALSRAHERTCLCRGLSTDERRGEEEEREARRVKTRPRKTCPRSEAAAAAARPRVASVRALSLYTERACGTGKGLIFRHASYVLYLLQ